MLPEAPPPIDPELVEAPLEPLEPLMAPVDPDPDPEPLVLVDEPPPPMLSQAARDKAAPTEAMMSAARW
jgi:hypothetical protein